MRFETLPVRVEVRTKALRDAAERGEEEAVAALAVAARATGVADEQVRARLASRESGEEMSGNGLWDAIKRFLTNTELRDQNRRREQWRWPLAVLGCPDVAGAEIELSLHAEHEIGDGVQLKLFGTGFEDMTTLAITDSISGTSQSGEHRLVFAGYDVDVIDFDLVRGGRVVSQGTRIDLIANTSVVGWLDLPSAPEWIRPASKVESLHYRGVKPNAKQQWSRELTYSHKFELVFGANFKPVELGAAVSYELTTKMQYRISLPGGGNWDVTRPDRCAGVTVVAAP